MKIYKSEGGLPYFLGPGQFRVFNLVFCDAKGCNNEARYNSGYCGLHDIEFNEGKGVRLSDSDKTAATP